MNPVNLIFLGTQENWNSVEEEQNLSENLVLKECDTELISDEIPESAPIEPSLMNPHVHLSPQVFSSKLSFFFK